MTLECNKHKYYKVVGLTDPKTVLVTLKDYLTTNHHGQLDILLTTTHIYDKVSDNACGWNVLKWVDPYTSI